ncbi:MAG: hypothetical protein WC365_01225 [Candidatus Babeliales bacterium]|jgi:hypothetical protein
MTAKLKLNQKKFNKMITGLAATWNCEHPCSSCPFNITDSKASDMIDELTHSEHCGAVAIRQIAKQIFFADASKKNKKQLHRL